MTKRLRVKHCYNAEAYNNRGVACQDKRDIEGALADYIKAIVIHSRHADALLSRANILSIKGDLNGAKENVRSRTGLRAEFKT